MAERKNFPLRIDRELYAALERWAADELRSVNAQIEFPLTDAVRRVGRLRSRRRARDAGHLIARSKRNVSFDVGAADYRARRGPPQVHG